MRATSTASVASPAAIVALVLSWTSVLLATCAMSPTTTTIHSPQAMSVESAITAPRVTSCRPLVRGTPSQTNLQRMWEDRRLIVLPVNLATSAKLAKEMRPSAHLATTVLQRLTIRYTPKICTLARKVLISRTTRLPTSTSASIVMQGIIAMRREWLAFRAVIARLVTTAHSGLLTRVLVPLVLIRASLVLSKKKLAKAAQWVNSVLKAPLSLLTVRMDSTVLSAVRK